MSLLLLFNQPATAPTSSPTTFIQSVAGGSGTNYVNSTTIAITPTAGNTLVLFIGSSAAAAGDITGVTDTKGNTWTKAIGAFANGRGGDFWIARSVASGATTITVASTNFTQKGLSLQEWANFPAGSLVDATGFAADSGFVQTHTATTSTATTTANSLVFAGYVGSNNTTVLSAGAGLSNLVVASPTDTDPTAMASQAATTQTTQSATITGTQYENGLAVVMALKSNAVAAAPTYTSPTTGVPGASAQSNWYTYGYAPAVALNTRQTYMQNAWNQWVSYTVTNTGMPAGMPAGAYRVKVPDQNDPNTGLPNGTFSEGIGYGMLASVWMGNPANPKYDANAHTYFDGFWKYYNFFKDSNGLMNWRIDHLGNITGTGGATDGDTDAALALVLASRLWGNAGTFNYGALATTLINAIATYEFYPANHANTAIRNTIINGDSWDATQSGSPDWVMPDYFAPAWYREFYNHTGNSRWLDIITAGYNQLIQPYDTAYNTGFVPDNATRAGGQQGTNGYKFAYNSIRYPWRMASDYLWNGTNTNSLAYYFPKKLANFSNTQAAGVASATKAEWAIDGSSNAGYINAAFTQAYTAATLVDSGSSTWGASLMAYSDANNTSAYFGNSLVLMTAILAAGQATPTPSLATPAANPGQFFAFF